MYRMEGIYMYLWIFEYLRYSNEWYLLNIIKYGRSSRTQNGGAVPYVWPYLLGYPLKFRPEKLGTLGPKVLVSLPAKLGGFVRANVGEYSTTMEHMGNIK